MLGSWFLEHPVNSRVFVEFFSELVWLRVSDRPTSQSDFIWALQNGCDMSS